MGDAAAYYDWLSLCAQTIVWRPLVGRDRYGAPEWGAPVSFRGRRVYKVDRVPSRGGGDAVALSDHVIWIMDKVAVGYEDAVYVDGDLPPRPVILNIVRYPDENGFEYTKVFMGKAQ
jgi:hypothetical protein